MSGAHGARERLEQSTLRLARGAAGRGELGLVEEAFCAGVEAVEEIGVDPFEIEHHPQGLAQARVLEHVTAQIEGEALHPLGIVVVERLLDDPAVARRREIIALDQRVGLCSSR